MSGLLLGSTSRDPLSGWEPRKIEIKFDCGSPRPNEGEGLGGEGDRDRLIFSPSGPEGALTFGVAFLGLVQLTFAPLRWSHICRTYMPQQALCISMYYYKEELGA
jgi:hypothetical protein